MMTCLVSSPFNLPLREAFGYQTRVQASEFTHWSLCLSASVPATTLSEIGFIHRILSVMALT